MSPHTAILFGATGATGRHVLQDLLASTHFTRVVEVGRRVTSEDQLAGYSGRKKLVQKVVDLEKIDEAGLKSENADAVIIALGTTLAKAGSQENFTKIDREIPIRAAKAAKSDSGSQRLLYISAIRASPKSWSFYGKSKGLTEQELSAVGYSDFIAFRPGMLKEADRGERRLAEDIASVVSGVLSHVTPHLEISVKTLAKSIVQAAELGSAALPATAERHVETPGGSIPPYSVILNKGALRMSNL